MKIKVVFNSFIIPPGYAAMTVYPYIFVSEGFISPNMLKHELIHCQQVERVGWLYFYISYLYYFIKNYFRYRDWGYAYSNIPYEIEAYFNEDLPLTDYERGMLSNYSS